MWREYMMEPKLTIQEMIDLLLNSPREFGDIWLEGWQVEAIANRLEKLKAVVELTDTLKHIVDHLPKQDEYLESFLRQTSDRIEDALAALEDK